MSTVLDAHALMVYLEREPGFESVKTLLIQALENNTPLLMTSVNVGEVLYIVRREQGASKAEEIEQIIHGLAIKVITVDLDLAREAARSKAHHPISYADCFSAALAKIHGAELVTGDPEFEAVESEVQVQWLPPKKGPGEISPGPGPQNL